MKRMQTFTGKSGHGVALPVQRIGKMLVSNLSQILGAASRAVLVMTRQAVAKKAQDGKQ